MFDKATLLMMRIQRDVHSRDRLFFWQGLFNIHNIVDPTLGFLVSCVSGTTSAKVPTFMVPHTFVPDRESNLHLSHLKRPVTHHATDGKSLIKKYSKIQLDRNLPTQSHYDRRRGHMETQVRSLKLPVWFSIMSQYRYVNGMISQVLDSFQHLSQNFSTHIQGRYLPPDYSSK